MRRQRKAKIVATLGPASATLPVLRALFEAGADVFRLNFSHGSHAQHRERVDMIRRLEQEFGRPIAILLDLQGPKLRIGCFAGGPITLEPGAAFRLDLDPAPGDAARVNLPHPEIFAALQPGAELLLDDGKLRLHVESCGLDHAHTRVVTGGPLSERKGVNVPGVLLPISALTPKDREDLAFGLTLGVEWVALSFVQRPEDLHELRELVGGRAALLAKLEKPAAMDCLEAVVDACDAVMVARGDLGVELPAETVPRLQKCIVRTCRRQGKPVIVATQMLESMVASPVPTRAEASDVATAVYDGADAVMLSAESAAGRYPVEAVAVMDRVIREVEGDPYYRTVIDASHVAPVASVADAVCTSLRQTAELLPIAALVTYTRSGATSLRAARERPAAPVLCITPQLSIARRLALAWGVHAVHVGAGIQDVAGMVETARAVARAQGFAAPGAPIAIAAGMPFGTAGTTNLLHITEA
ncbi:pyruvate kinase [Azohydromonas lata]|uniref:Pyruvate kinase n=1 Tax=Azohydromonas lata TaxID=45677 RepID=A0ABU5IEN7_9BURK|nr:pyruvate kinase [Azohydromonas lata]MDZ5457556.1 pyruvate kinase [Azohydromonas lata]